ncbi:Aste57867_10583 [Aphanomyces stellatus]|uniref:Aste57867_10583 protein n=1 Tax=Aphanomyces stellatus TaxID=120398 RepID=A0A485KR94_9STRA|nr:hypothetical protein As57867_010543 [Aphanomyces stellatus]VFT87455.1 Aste57867_10583 [Aphanomyces stellatus]
MRVVERANEDRPASGGPERDGAKPATVIDRDTTCPSLVRVFCGGSHNRPEAYNSMVDKPLSNEYHIYTWPDATLREIAELIQDANDDARKQNRLAISLVYPDRRGKHIVKKAGIVNTSRKSPDEDKTLAGIGFQNGDYLDVAILT